jgi:hypothetical protein
MREGQSKDPDGLVRPISVDGIFIPSSLPSYSEQSGASLAYDVHVLTDYFSRVWRIYSQGSLDSYSVASLIGGHACWWDLAFEIGTTDRRSATLSLRNFAEWTNAFAESHGSDPEFSKWGKNRLADFGYLARTDGPTGKRL